MREVLGSIARTKLGMPIVTVEIRLICALVMGKGSVKISDTSAKVKLNMFLVR